MRYERACHRWRVHGTIARWRWRRWRRWQFSQFNGPEILFRRIAAVEARILWMNFTKVHSFHCVSCAFCRNQPIWLTGITWCCVLCYSELFQEFRRGAYRLPFQSHTSQFNRSEHEHSPGTTRKKFFPLKMIGTKTYRATEWVTSFGEPQNHRIRLLRWEQNRRIYVDNCECHAVDHLIRSIVFIENTWNFSATTKRKGKTENWKFHFVRFAKSHRLRSNNSESDIDRVWGRTGMQTKNDEEPLDRNRAKHEKGGRSELIISRRNAHLSSATRRRKHFLVNRGSTAANHQVEWCCRVSWSWSTATASHTHGQCLEPMPDFRNKSSMREETANAVPFRGRKSWLLPGLLRSLAYDFAKKTRWATNLHTFRSCAPNVWQNHDRLYLGLCSIENVTNCEHFNNKSVLIKINWTSFNGLRLMRTIAFICRPKVMFFSFHTAVNGAKSKERTAWKVTQIIP